MGLKTIIYSRRYRPIRDIMLFAVLLLGFHFFFRFWANHLHYAPLLSVIYPTYEFLTNLLFNNSVWVLKHLTSYEFTTQGRIILIGPGHVTVDYNCSGLKPLLEWIFLMTVFPGPWKHKLWFIPLGLVITHAVNVFRITGLAILLKYYPEHWHFAHSYIFRPFFYVVMFGLWVWWVEKYRNPSRHIEK